uniref:Pyridine nucleotide-disulfide oxidoreductase domain-containing protein 1 n=1 Tax=Panagrolaimus superbus TaxID=310955 RepID=A0A914Y8E0_9BILA
MYVVVGGGVAGVCCVQELVQLLDNYSTSSSNSSSTVLNGPKITFICGSAGFIKTVDEVSKVTKVLETIKVKESPVSSYFPTDKVKVIQENVKSWDSKKKILFLSNGDQIIYDKLCIATGASPINNFENENVLTLRDLDTVEILKKRLETARRVVLVGNGGIANELAYELKGVEIIWAIRHLTIAASYFDKQAATLFLPRLAAGRLNESLKPEAVRTRYTISSHIESTSEADPSTSGGCALGPYWLSKLEQKDGNKKRKVHIIKDVEVANIENWDISKHSTLTDLPDEFEADTNGWKAFVLFSNGETVGCDLVIFGIGVTPNSEIWKNGNSDLKIANDNGIEINDKMETSIKDVYCAGDICTAKGFHSKHWSQMRLWTQARSMGIYCARSMLFKDVEADICFEIFTHNTNFYGFNVVFLGDFAGEHLETPYDADVRCSPEQEYIKVLTKDNRVHGVVLVGETDLAETFENLILDQTDVSPIIDDLLNPHFDIEDYYD